MNKKNLIILNNEKIYNDGQNFFCDNLDLKVVPEGLNNFFNVKFIARKAKKKGNQKIKLNNIDVAPNIFSFIFFILKSFKSKSKYLIISITPYTFIAYLILLIFRKKIYLYLWSDGYEEWKHLLGKWHVWIYHVMYTVCTLKSEIIVCNKRLTKKKSHLISISRLDEPWFQKHKEVSNLVPSFLYVGRMSKEKGIFDFIDMLKKIKINAKLEIAGYSDNSNCENSNIKFLGYISNPIDLIEAYDKCNITILPSYTEGYPYVVDESLARKRPVIIFDEISYVADGKKGVFVSKRNHESLEKAVKNILQNYKNIQVEMSKNLLPTKKSMLKQISDIIDI